MMTCNSCEREFDSDNMRWFGDDPYCEDCFFDSFTFCSRCEETIDREYVRYNSSDEAMCSDCYEEDEDPDAPDDPEVFDNQRNEIISLAKDWLTGKRPKKLIKINHNDFLLPEIQAGVGLVSHSLYLYGLQDRDDYQIMASTNLFNRVSQYITLNNWNVKVAHDVGINRIGISRSIREAKLEDIINLLKELTTIKTPQEIAA